MEVLGLSHPVTSKTATIMQKMQELSRPEPTGAAPAVQASAAAATTGAAGPVSIAPTQAVMPSNATRESLLEARKPTEPETAARQISDARGSDGEQPPENTTYDFPEELPMNFREVIDMLRGDEAIPGVPETSPVTASQDGLGVSDPANAAEAQRLNRTA